MVLSWPKQIKERGGLRSQFGHVNDIAPTILEAVGIEAPQEVNGIAQKRMNGTSLVYSFNDKNAAERHRTQYFEVFGHRAIYHDGWIASAFHTRKPWGIGMASDAKPFEQDRWELYDLRTDFSQAKDLVSKEPAKLEEMKALFMQEAAANQALPLGRQQASAKGLPSLADGVTRAVYHQGTIGVPETAVPKMANHSWSLKSRIDVTDGTRGVIATIGGTSAGWALYVNAQRQPVFIYKLFDLKTIDLAGVPLPAGSHDVDVNFDYDGPGYGEGGKITLMVDGTVVATDNVPASPPAFFSIDETFDVGVDTGSSAGRYPADAPIGFPYAGGKIKDVAIEVR